MQRKETTYTYSIMYIMVYRHTQSDLIYELIKPFTVDDRLFQKLLNVMIFVDTESGIPFTQLMNKEFSKIKSSPAIIRVVGCDIITNMNDITEIMKNVYNECVSSLSIDFEQPFDNSICERDDHYITEQIYNNTSVMDTTNGGLLQDYAAQYQQENLNRTQIQYPEQPVSTGPQCAQIKDVPIKNLTVATGDTIKTNLSSMQLNI